MKKLLLITTLGLSTMAMANYTDNRSMQELEKTLKENNTKIMQQLEEDHVNHAVILSLKSENEKIRKEIKENQQ